LLGNYQKEIKERSKLRAKDSCLDVYGKKNAFKHGPDKGLLLGLLHFFQVDKNHDSLLVN
jgi:hypothetical protein